MPIKIHGKEYITVAERIRLAKDFITDISTEVLQFEPKVVVRVTVILKDGRKATGISAANPNKLLEKESPFEIAETSALGRSLGFLNFGLTNDIATADEMIKAGVSPSQEIKKTDADLDDLKPEDFVNTIKLVKEPLRDTKGHTYCSTCGKVINPAEEKFSMSKYGKTLCFNCQKKETK
jgi:hypothetical protein